LRRKAPQLTSGVLICLNRSGASYKKEISMRYTNESNSDIFR